MTIDPASFRDDRGFMYHEGGQLLRQINPAGKDSYELLMKSGLYQELIDRSLLVKHTEEKSKSAEAYKVIKPELVPFISYPYEWSFSQLKDAALATLAIQKLAMDKGQTLRDGSAYNIQFVGGKPVLIDTLSFEAYKEGAPWQAYRQFCQHFLAPLALMSHVNPDLSQLLRVYIDGVPLGLAAKLLPGRSLFNPGIYMHVKLHGRFQESHADDAKAPTARTVSRIALLGVLDSLERTIKGLHLNKKAKTEWGNYYKDTNYNEAGFADKKKLVSSALGTIKPQRVIDLGANDGTFSRLAKDAELIISADVDPLAIDHNYLKMRRDQTTNLLPLLIDLTNPSPAIGWANQERSSFGERARADVTLALALVHHLAIGDNLPLGMVAQFLALLSPNLIIEWVPKTDSQVQRLLATREDIFKDYTQAGFEKAFGAYFSISSKAQISDSERIIYVMKVRRGKN